MSAGDIEAAMDTTNQTVQSVTTNLNAIPMVESLTAPAAAATATATATAATMKPLIILAVGIAVSLGVITVIVVPIVVTNTNANVKPAGGTVVNTTTAASVITTTVGLPSQCSSYTQNTDATRKVTYAGGSTCDSSTFLSSGTWIRFSGSAGTELATSAPSANSCNTQGTGWYSGSYPSVGSTTNGTVCYVWSGNTCNWDNIISVTNCNGFYVYFLTTPPACNLRYCTT